ncbi:MAG TPA: filamentous hemagglutinin N-terminal domain-containing protein [Pseudomonas oleovorans]|nr:filamentous hemagglutinin N-terminal domain-containing protein [Pseudomonas oleovorans]
MAGWSIDMDVRSPLYQNIALIVAGVLFLNPIVATAAQLAVDQAAAGNTAVTQAQNGVPMVNIATPNGSGLSHNKFTDYNVGQQGLILNNSAQNVVQTQLGGYVVGNPNLKNGAAGLILNEVTGGNASQLRGYTEVAGRSAAVIVANPHGITCDGCGFINTPRITLSTGSPVVEDGRLQRFDVDGGQISIEGAGLNAGNVDQFDLITRSAQINAELHAKKLNIITGRNDVDATTLAATAKADDGSDKPMLAIDSSALGGMYAGAIRLVGTEQGVGVKLAGDMAASAGDIQIDANGKLSLARVAASNDLKLAAEEIELGADTYAGRNAVVSATGKTQVKDSLAAGNRVEIGGGELDNQGVVEAGVKADGTLVSDSALVLNSRSVTNRGELIARGNFEADVEVLDNSSGKLLSAGNANIQAAQLSNSQGQVIAQRNLELGGGALSNQDGEVLAAGELHVDAASLDNQSGTVAANAIDLKLSGALSNAQGLIESSQALALAVDSVQNRDGRLRALASSDKSAFLVGNLFDNDQGLVEIGNAAFALASGSLSNQGGAMRHLGSQGFELNLADLGNAGGRFSTNGELSLSADDWNNTSELQAERLTLNIGQFTQTATGQLISRQSITANGDNWINDGVIATDGSLDLTLTGRYEGNGALRSLGDLTFKAASAEFGSDAEAKSGSAARFELSGQLLSRGRLTAAQDMSLALGSLDNRGTLGGAGLLRIEADSLRNEQGLVFSGADMTLRTASLVNLFGDIYSLGALDVARDEQGGNLDLLENRSASIESTRDMTLRSTVLHNRKEVFDWQLAQTYGGISVVCYDCGGDHHNVDYLATERFEARVEEDSAAARIHSGANLLLKGSEVANRYSTLSAAGDIDIDADSLENTGATLASVERVRRYNTGRVTDGTDERFRDNYIHPYNAQPLPKVLPTALARWSLVSDIQTETPIGVAAPGIIQAGGDVRVQATQPITNDSILAHNAPQAGAEQTLETTISSATQPLVVQLNPQLPANTAQQAVDPIALPSFGLPQGQNGLFRTNTDPGHRYLIETNPAFADLKQFVSSDYMLGLLGFENDVAQKRLGDGLYEQRLLEQAIAARTGKRYLDGFTNNDAQFRYLMDNAIASKDALNLSVGIGLSSAQVAALTHDIVWLEEREVNGEKVLVPVLYLAQVGDRLAPSGALIQGQDVALISGGSLNNSGTLRATKSLDVNVANVTNSGLMQANQRLQLLATDSIRNAQGGIINGQDVSLIALTGDIRNERTISQQSVEGKGYSQLTSVVDKAAGIEAGNDLQLLAGGDIQNIGGSLKAGGDAKLNAGGDVIIAAAAEEHGSMRKDKRHFWSTTSTTQHGSDVQVGGDLAVTAGQDIAVVASSLKAESDISLDAGRDVTITSAANESSSEYRYKRSDKKINKENSSVRQQAAEIVAGGDLEVTAQRNLVLSASTLKAQGEAYLYAGGQLASLAAQNSDYYLYDMKKKGSWGSKKTQRDEVTTVRNVGSSITTGGDLTLVSEGDQLYQKARLESGNDLILDSGGAITFEAVKDLDQESHEKSSSSWAWTSAKGKGKTDETLKQSELIAQGDLIIQAVNGLKIDIKEVNQQSVSQTIDAMVKADPELAWLKEMEQRGDVDWRQVKEVHDSFKYSHSGLGGPAAMIIAIIVTYLTWGAGSGLVGAAQGTWQAAVADTVVSSVASNAATSTINNRGNLSAVVKDVTSSDAIRGYVVGGVTAGLTVGLFDGLLQTKTDPLSGKVTVDLSSLEGVGRFAGNQILQNGTSTILDRALGGDSSLSDALRTSLANTFAAAGFNLIGDQTSSDKWDLKDGSAAKIGLHAVMGGLAAEAAGGDFRTGALAAGVNEALVDSLSSWYGEMDSEQKKSLLVMNSQVIGVLTATAQGGDENALQTGSWVAGTATTYNYLNHAEANERREKQKECTGGDKSACNRVDQLNALDKARDQALQSACRADAAGAACSKLLADAQIARNSFKPYEGTAEWNAQYNDNPLLEQYSFYNEVQSITNALAQAPQTTPETKRLVDAIVGLGADFTPGVGDVKALVEAETPFDYLMASVGVVPVLGDAVAQGIKQAKKLFKEGKVAESAKVLEDLSDGTKATGGAVPEVLSPTYRELQGLNKGFQAHHILPQYLGKMLGYTKNDMLDHPATLITQYSHTGKVNPDAMHKAISKYLPPMVGGKQANYTSGQIWEGLQKAYSEIGRPELFDSVKHLIR